jgi:hypothetical protein
MVAIINFGCHVFIVSYNNIVRRRKIKVVVAVENHQKSLQKISYPSPMLILLVLPLLDHLRLLMEMLKPTVTPM